MTQRQRFWIIIVLVVLVVVGIIATTVDFVVNGVASSQSPSVGYVTGIGTTVVLMLIGIIQNTSLQQVTQETKQIVNGGLARRVEQEVARVLGRPASPTAEPATIPPQSAPTDPHAQAGS